MEVDPRHILGIKQDHGAYFEEVIGQCGLETKNVVIIMAVNSHYARHYQELVAGLDNYRRRGYQIALKFDYVGQENQSSELIAKLSPNYVSLSARHLDQVQHNTLFEKLHNLSAQVASVGGRSILQQIDQKNPNCWRAISVLIWCRAAIMSAPRQRYFRRNFPRSTSVAPMLSSLKILNTAFSI